MLCEANADTGTEDWDDLQRVMDYLHSHPSGTIVMRSGGTTEVVLAADASFASQKNFRSRSGFVVSLRGTGTVAFGSRAQSSVAVSTTDAELNAQIDGLRCAL